jgi:ClpP class serine protease
VRSWLLEESVARRLEAARLGASPEFIASAHASARSASPGSPATISGGVMTIPVAGVLTKEPDFWAMIFGEANTTYASIIDALAAAEIDAHVKSVVLAVNSPGGTVDGLFEAIAAVENFSKPISAVADSAQSAAYGLAAATGKIQATSRASTFGSIGVAASYRLQDNVVDLTNSDSPNKRPDLKTDAGKAVVVEYLDQINDLFVEAIAKGRGVPDAKVRKGYGRGSSMTADAALEMGLIDSIQAPAAAPKRKTMAASSEENVAAQLAAVTAERDALLTGSKELSAQVAKLTEQVGALAAKADQEKLVAFVDQIQREGKLPPALRAWALTQTRTSLEAFAAAAPVASAVAKPSPATSPSAVVEAVSASAELNADELYACQLTGTDPKAFRAERDRQAAERAARLAGSN